MSVDVRECFIVDEIFGGFSPPIGRIVPLTTLVLTILVLSRIRKTNSLPLFERLQEVTRYQSYLIVLI